MSLQETDPTVVFTLTPGHLQILLSGLGDRDDMRMAELAIGCEVSIKETKIPGRWAINIVAKR